MNSITCPHCNQKIEVKENSDDTCINLVWNDVLTAGKAIGYYCKIGIVRDICGKSCMCYQSMKEKG